MILNMYFYYTLVTLLCLSGGGLFLWLVRKISMALHWRGFGAILCGILASGIILSSKSSLIVINEDVTTRYAVWGEAEFEMANGEKVPLTYQPSGEFLINNTSDTCVIERVEYYANDSYDFYESLDSLTGSKLSAILILIKPMNMFFFKGGTIDYVFETPPREKEMTKNREVFHYLRSFQASDWQNYYLFDGPVINGLPEGEGITWISQNSLYVGEHVGGKFEGEGILYYEDGTFYEGEFENDLSHGYGVYYYPDSSVYEGNWNEGTIEGAGIYYDNFGGYYDGEFSNDLLHGYGTYYFSDSSLYEGNWVEGYMEGFGKYTYANGDYYEGYFVQDLFDGPGKRVYVSSGKIEEGIWREGVFTRNND